MRTLDRAVRPATWIITTLVALIAIPSLLAAQPQIGVTGNRRFDARNLPPSSAAEAPGSAQQREIANARRSMPHLVAGFDTRTGVTRTLSNQHGYLSEPDEGRHLVVARGYVSDHAELLGLTAADLQNSEIRSEHASPATGASRIFLRQTARGLPVYNGQLQINVNRDGRILSVNNAFLRDLEGSINTTKPSLARAEAVQRAADEVGVVPSDAALASARLMLLPIRAGEARLVWNLQLEVPQGPHHFDINVDAVTGKLWTQFDWVAAETGFASTLFVYPAPVESPNHTTPPPPTDARSLVVNPADPLASPLGWHDNGTTSFTIMRGNNVHAYDDRDNDGAPPTQEPDCGFFLGCNFPLNLSQAPATYIDASVANVFYWSNLVHDVQYQYGFDEAAGNFQVDNFGRGGVGGDDVRAQVQDGGETCGGFFTSEPDGQRGLMEMHTCLNRDGSLDNAVIVHEYGHGISNRTVGGPLNTSCLQNMQQPGEGWSDLLALMYTAEPGDIGTDARGIGTYLFGQAANGPGIRPAPYSTDFSVNNYTYADMNAAVAIGGWPHGVGFVWATAVWDAYWELVDFHGFDPNLANAFGGAGNQRMMLYLQEGMANTACGPSLLDARDGLIQAAADNYGGEDVCRIWNAFARRGLGADATTSGPGSLSATNGFQSPCEVWVDATNTGPEDGSFDNPFNTVLEGSNALTIPGGTVKISAGSYPEIPTLGSGEGTVRQTLEAVQGSVVIGK